METKKIIETLRHCAAGGSCRGCPRYNQDSGCLNRLHEVIGRQRTVDAAEVVRCRGCKSYDGDCGYCEAMGFTCKPDDFCSYGERKTDG